MPLAVLLRNCSHASSTLSDATNATTYQRYALQCDSVQINIQKSPIHLSVPKNINIIDLNTSKPTIVISGVVDVIGGDDSTSTTGFENMTQIAITRKYWAFSTDGNSTYENNEFTWTDKAQNYYVPYKNKLEEIVYEFQSKSNNDDQQLEIEIGDANFPIYNRAAEYISSSLTPWASGENRTVVPGVTVRETGGAVYVVAIQSIKFDLEPGMEDRYRFQMQFITEYRKDFKF